MNKDKKNKDVNIHKHYDNMNEHFFRACEISRLNHSISLRSFDRNEDMNYLVSKALEIFDHVYSRCEKDVNDKDVS